MHLRKHEYRYELFAYTYTYLFCERDGKHLFERWINSSAQKTQHENFCKDRLISLHAQMIVGRLHTLSARFYPRIQTHHQHFLDSARAKYGNILWFNTEGIETYTA